MQKRNFARKYSNMPLLLHFEKKSCTWHNMPQPFRCTNAAVVINVYEFQKAEKQEKEAQGRDTILILKLSSQEKQKLLT